MNDDKAFRIDDYLRIMNLSYLIANSMRDERIKDFEMPGCKQLAEKIFDHSSSVYQLFNGTKIPIINGDNQIFYNNLSVAVLARTILETFLTMYEIFLFTTTDDEFEFNYVLWLLSVIKSVEYYKSLKPYADIRSQQIQQNIQLLQSRMRKTNKFLQLSRKKQNEVLKGIRKVNWTQISKHLGISEIFLHKFLYSSLSDCVHAGSFSLNSCGLGTLQDRKDEIEFNMFLIMSINSMMIIESSKVFSEAKCIIEANQYDLILVEVYSKFLKNYSNQEFDSVY